jgi:hypothetical protein
MLTRVPGLCVRPLATIGEHLEGQILAKPDTRDLRNRAGLAMCQQRVGHGHLDVGLIRGIDQYVIREPLSWSSQAGGNPLM